MITGKYVVSSGGKIIGEYKNMLTNNGLLVINQYLSGQTRDWGGSLALGLLSSSATTASTTTLQFETARYPTNFKAFRTVSGSNQIVLKATLDPTDDYDVYEIGIIPNKVDLSTYSDNYLITAFSETNGGSTNWFYNNGTLAVTSSATPSPRNGGYMVNVPVTTVGTTNTVYTGGLNFNSSAYSENDTLSILYYCSSAITAASISVIFGDNSPTQVTWSSSTASIASVASGAFYSASLAMQTKPTITEPIINASVTVYGSGGSVAFDALKFVLGTQLTTDYQLVSRSISSTTTTPLFSKIYSQPMDIEYYIQVT
jgi:hypothetical protein